MSGAIVVMGVSGCGKSTLGRALADALGWRFLEGDALHPRANVTKMAAGIPLDDEDRRPFLERIAQEIAWQRKHGVVVACSALKRSYREFIQARAGQVRFVLPVVDRDTLFARLARRRDHFMPASLLESQLDALEVPAPEERTVLVDGTDPIYAQVARVLAELEVQSKISEPREARR